MCGLQIELFAAVRFEEPLNHNTNKQQITEK
jgi:hypothetical protein